MRRHLKVRLLVLLISTAVLIFADQHAKIEAVMAETAQRFLHSLSAGQKEQAVFGFDNPYRTEWHFFPDFVFPQTYGHDREGVSYKQMSAEQERLADSLLGTGLSRQGFVKAMTVMSLEGILRVLEKDTAGRRDTKLYYFTVFGSPSPTGTWGWSVEGHHLSLNYTIKDGRLVSASPTFFGANPHEVREGDRKGLRTLEREEGLARKLVRLLTQDQQKQAIVADVAYKDILTVAETRAKLEGQPEGLPASEMSEEQLDVLMDLIAEYAHNMPPEIAAGRMKAALATPPGKLYFAWAGSVEPGVGDYYRVQSPAFLIEYDNTQNENNHSHSVWRDFEGDFGFDVLAWHHRRHEHGLPGKKIPGPEFLAD